MHRFGVTFVKKMNLVLLINPCKYYSKKRKKVNGCMVQNVKRFRNYLITGNWYSNFKLNLNEKYYNIKGKILVSIMLC